MGVTIRCPLGKDDLQRRVDPCFMASLRDVTIPHQHLHRWPQVPDAAPVVSCRGGSGACRATSGRQRRSAPKPCTHKQQRRARTHTYERARRDDAASLESGAAAVQSTFTARRALEEGERTEGGASVATKLHSTPETRRCGRGLARGAGRAASSPSDTSSRERRSHHRGAHRASKRLDASVGAPVVSPTGGALLLGQTSAGQAAAPRHSSRARQQQRRLSKAQQQQQQQQDDAPAGADAGRGPAPGAPAIWRPRAAGPRVVLHANRGHQQAGHRRAGASGHQRLCVSGLAGESSARGSERASAHVPHRSADAPFPGSSRIPTGRTPAACFVSLTHLPLFPARSPATSNSPRGGPRSRPRTASRTPARPWRTRPGPTSGPTSRASWW